MTAPATGGAPDLGLFARIAGVLTAPRATFERVVASPRPVLILLVVAIVVGLAGAVPQFSEAGQQAILDAQAAARESMGRPMSADEYAVMERLAPYFPYFTLGQILIFLPIFCLVIAALCWVAFNTVLGGAATFKQVLAIVTHSQVVGALGAVVAAPIQALQGTVTAGGPFNLGVLVPMLDESSTLARLLGITNVFTIWWLVVMAIGFGVLYRRKSTNVAIGLIVAYGAIAYTLIAVFGSMFGGGQGR